MINKRVRFVVLRHSHHSPHSGYSRVSEYGAKQYEGDIFKARPLPRSIIRNRIMWKFANGVIAYDRTSMAAELKVAWHLLKEKGYIYHILYGENTYHYLGLLNNFRQNRLVATFHQPPSVIREGIKVDWHIRQLSAVVCVGQSQRPFFANFLDEDKIFFVPLGVDTEYFTPPTSLTERDADLCLFVGEHLRDLPTLRGVIELVAFQRPETKFVAITRPRAFERIGTHPNLTLLSGIPEAQLRDLYRSASLLIMPLKDATANNAIVEAMACGLPMVLTDIGSSRDYVNSESAVFVPPYDSQKMAEEVLNLLGDSHRRQKMSEQARQQALNFSWPRVVNQLRNVYEAVV